MYTIQYLDTTTRKSVMETLNSRDRRKLVWRLARFEHEILAIYEQGTPVTKRTRTQLAEASFRGDVELTPAAKTFAMGGIRLTTPA